MQKTLSIRSMATLTDTKYTVQSAGEKDCWTMEISPSLLMRFTSIVPSNRNILMIDSFLYLSCSNFGGGDGAAMLHEILIASPDHQLEKNKCL